MDLNERIARLLEPERESDPTWVGYHWNEEYCQVEPRPFDRSIDASMRVIEAKWPGADVEIKTPKPHYEFFLASLCHMPTEDRPSLLAQEVSKESASEALALALCAALEAEPTP